MFFLIKFHKNRTLLDRSRKPCYLLHHQTKNSSFILGLENTLVLQTIATCSIMCVVVIPKHIQMGSFPNSYLSYVRHEVIWYTLK